MTGREIKRRKGGRERNERRGWILLEKRSEATMAGAGFKVGSSPRSKSRFPRFRLVSDSLCFASFLSFFLSFPFLSSLNR